VSLTIILSIHDVAEAATRTVLFGVATHITAGPGSPAILPMKSIDPPSLSPHHPERKRSAKSILLALPLATTPPQTTMRARKGDSKT
jgi:hypothetical protein